MNIFKYLFGIDEMGDSSRDYVAKNSKEGVDPRSNISDWGEFDEDHNQSEHDRAAGNAQNRDSDGVGYPTQTETERYYETTRYTDIEILRGEEF